VPFLRHFSTLARQEYLLGVLFSDFLIIENVCIGFYIKIAVVDVWKNLYSREKLKSKYDFTLHHPSPSFIFFAVFSPLLATIDWLFVRFEI